METPFYENVDFDNMTLNKFLEIEAELLRHAELFGTVGFCRFRHVLEEIFAHDHTFRQRLDAAYRPLPEALQDEKDLSKIKTKLNVYHLLTTPERRKAAERALGRDFVKELAGRFAEEHDWFVDSPIWWE